MNPKTPPDNRLAKLNRMQYDSLMAWKEAGYRGTVNVFTGGGKSFIALKAIMHLHKEGRISIGDPILFLAETNQREITMEEESSKFEQIFGVNPWKLFKVQFACYQAQREGGSYALVIADEIHDAMTAQYHRVFYRNNIHHLMGLSATIPKRLNVFRSRIPDEMVNRVRQGRLFTENGIITDTITKEEMIEIVAPVVYSYSIDKAIAEGLSAPFKIVKVLHRLDDKIRMVKTWKGHDLLDTEQSAYDKYNSIVKDFRVHEGRRKVFGRKQARMLYNLQSKRRVINTLRSGLLKDKRTMLLGVERKLFEGLTPNIAMGKDAAKVVDQWQKGEIDFIASCKKLKQGVTLDGIEALILGSYYSTGHTLVQLIGRVVRFVPGKIGEVYIIVTEGTLEEKWFDKMMRDNPTFEVTQTINLNA